MAQDTAILKERRGTMKEGVSRFKAHGSVTKAAVSARTGSGVKPLWRPVPEDLFPIPVARFYK